MTFVTSLYFAPSNLSNPAQIPAPCEKIFMEILRLCAAESAVGKISRGEQIWTKPVYGGLLKIVKQNQYVDRIFFIYLFSSSMQNCEKCKVLAFLIIFSCNAIFPPTKVLFVHVGAKLVLSSG